MSHPSWLDDDRRRIVAVYSDKPHSRCQCRWDKTGEAFGDGKYWVMVERRKGCSLHGAQGEH